MPQARETVLVLFSLDYQGFQTEKAKSAKKNASGIFFRNLLDQACKGRFDLRREPLILLNRSNLPNPIPTFHSSKRQPPTQSAAPGSSQQAQSNSLPHQLPLSAAFISLLWMHFLSNQPYAARHCPRLPALSQWQDSRETYAPEAKWKEKERFAAKIPPNVCQTQIFLLEIIRTERNLPRIFPNSIRFGRFLPRRSPVKQFSGKGNTFRPPFSTFQFGCFLPRSKGAG